MKSILMTFFIIICFVFIYKKIIVREKFYNNVLIVQNVDELVPKKTYIFQEKNAFILDFEYYYFDYLHNKGNVYAMAEKEIIEQIIKKYNILDWVLPTKFFVDGNELVYINYMETEGK